MPLDAVLFDKDGTLFDFAATWNSWAGGVIADLSGGDDGRAQAMAAALEYDLDRQEFFPASFVVYATNAEAAAALVPHCEGSSQHELETYLATRAATAPISEVVPLASYMAGLRGDGLKLGVMTNDAELSAHSQLERVGAHNSFDFIAGHDSGFGAKPDPDPLLAFCKAVNVAPGRCAMVGDSLHDLHAGRAAGMICIGVLTGTAQAAHLSPHADVVLQDIGEIPAWIAANR